MNHLDQRLTNPDAPTILRETLGAVAVLTLNRPAQRNALSEDMIAELHASVRAIAGEASIRAVILAANGPLFCSGHDLKQLTIRRADADGGRAYFRQIMAACSAMMQSLIDLPQPVIACVQGLATAAGCQLVASCDLAVASDKAGFATPGVDIGLFCTTPMVALTRNVPPKNAMELLLTGRPISADRAYAIGLVNRVVIAGREFETALALARDIEAKPPRVVALGKAAFYRQRGMSLADAYDHAVEVMTTNMMLDDAKEGIGAFVEKRDPKWQD